MVDPTHILRDCRLHKDYHYILEEISSSIYSPDIFGTHKGIKALMEFLYKSNAYTRSGTGPPTCQKPTTERSLEECSEERLEVEHPKHHLAQYNEQIFLFLFLVITPSNT